MRSFRRRDEAELQAELVTLTERRSDLALVRCTELFGAAIARLQDRYGVTGRVPTAAAIGAWIDTVVPPDPAAAIPPAAGSVPYPPDPNAIALLTDPASEVIARGLLALAGRRRDLSDLQRHELFLAGLVHLVVRKAGFIIGPRRPQIFTWIDLVAPVRSPAADAPARGQSDPQVGAPGIAITPARSPGRPVGTRYIADRAAVIVAYRRAGKLPSRNPAAIPSQEIVAGVLDVSRRTLAKFLKDEGIPWPPE